MFAPNIYGHIAVWVTNEYYYVIACTDTDRGVIVLSDPQTPCITRSVEIIGPVDFGSISDSKVILGKKNCLNRRTLWYQY